MTPTTPALFVIAPGSHGPKIHKATCKRIAGRTSTSPARSAHPDVFALAETATCCKPSDEAICEERRTVEPETPAIGICAALDTLTAPAQAKAPRSLAAARKAEHRATADGQTTRMKAKGAEADAADRFIEQARSAAKAGTLTIDTDPYARAVTLKREARNKRGAGRPVTDPILEEWLRGLLAAHPDYRFRQAIEVGYWVQQYAASPARYAAAWAAVTGTEPEVKHRGAA